MPPLDLSRGDTPFLPSETRNAEISSTSSNTDTVQTAQHGAPPCAQGDRRGHKSGTVPLQSLNQKRTLKTPEVSQPPSLHPSRGCHGNSGTDLAHLLCASHQRINGFCFLHFQPQNSGLRPLPHLPPPSSLQCRHLEGLFPVRPLCLWAFVL